MYWFWYFLFASQPALLLLGMTGFLGDEAKKAAEDLGEVLGVMVIVIIIIAAIYFLIQGVATALGYGFVFAIPV